MPYLTVEMLELRMLLDESDRAECAAAAYYDAAEKAATHRPSEADALLVKFRRSTVEQAKAELQLKALMPHLTAALPLV